MFKLNKDGFNVYKMLDIVFLLNQRIVESCLVEIHDCSLFKIKKRWFIFSSQILLPQTIADSFTSQRDGQTSKTSVSLKTIFSS